MTFKNYLTGIMVLTLFFITNSCESKDNKKKFDLSKLPEERKQLYQLTGFVDIDGYGGDFKVSDEIKYSIRIQEKKRKDIDFYKEDTSELAAETTGRGILWENFKVDLMNKTLSLSKKNGDLIVTLKILDANHFQIVDYGKWMLDNKLFTNDMNKMDKKMWQELWDEHNARVRFSGGFTDTNVVYSW